MTVEERLRAATRAIDATMRPVRPLRLPATPERGAKSRQRTERSWTGWLIPLTAAVVVVAAAGTLVAIRAVPWATPQPAQRPAVKASHATSGPATDPEALPAYFAALRDPSAGLTSAGPGAVVIGETRTGRQVATVTPPAGSTFVGVTGASDDRTFVLDAMSASTSPVGLMTPGTHAWYLLTLAPDTAGPRLAKLAIPPTSNEIEGIALSPDGTKLAVLCQLGQGLPATGPIVLDIYSVATGALLHSWTGTDPYHGSYGYGSQSPPDNNRNLTWTADDTKLAFDYRSSTSPDSTLYLRMVNLASPGTSLFTDSKVILKIANLPKPAIWCGTLGITTDGQAAVCGADLPKVAPVGITLAALTRPAPWIGCSAPADLNYPGLAEISLATRKLTRVLYQVTPACMGTGEGSILWASPSGDTVLGSVWYTDDPSMKTHTKMVLVSHGVVTPLPWTAAVPFLSSAAF